ncbi:hypothetical protein RUM44_000683 [Polyplax serrata]|uniref:tRNA-dihydrouridine(47) synthase [NAD(P)(+)] n=1 Tax=Polyplax serrata TaxID=468196 RepID=A0ABR1B715_POLSC
MTNEVDSNKGIAYIKAEFVIQNEDTGETVAKKAKLEEEPKKKQKGQFKNRYNQNKLQFDHSKSLCSCLKDVPEDAEKLPECKVEKCKYLHDVKEYMEVKLPDIGNTCYVFSTKGYCPRGVTCRFGKSHITSDGRNKKNKEIIDNFEKNGLKVKNCHFKEIQIKLRKKKYNFGKSLEILKDLPGFRNSDNFGIPSEDATTPDMENSSKTESEEPEKPVGPCSDEDLCRLRQEEKRNINWNGKLYLSPLTTLGNLPFRRICKEFGADITCSEMAMATSLLQGLPYEWALTKRHQSEDLFGIQLCGNNPYLMTKCAQLLEETTEIDYIDINLGCPIDLVYQKGGGSGLLRREKVLETVVTCMSRVMSLPLTVKTRTGVYAEKNIAHRLIPMFVNAGVSMVTVHGRSREQRYTRTADWSYINECAISAPTIPIFGNGDILSYEDYNLALENNKDVAGVMIGRGALYKPWIFTEIKEQRNWDISSGERFDIIKKFVNYGLDHWGSDTMGVELTRKFTLEWLSFLYRYIPVGLLERPPQRINERPPKYFGRNDLETLMASPNCSDWVKITEMLLGPVPENFHFLPKHKANSWAS